MSIFKYGGIDVIESMAATVPKMTLSKDVLVSNEFRIKQDAWLERLFGRVPGAYMINNDTLLAHPTVIKEMEKAIGKRVQDSVERYMLEMFK